MDEQTDGLMSRRTDGWMDRQMDGFKDEQMNGWIYSWMDTEQTRWKRISNI